MEEIQYDPRGYREEAFASVYIRKDRKLKQIERQTIDLSTAIGVAGGFVGALSYFFSSLSAFYGDKFYFGSILNKIYRLRGMPEISKI
jgi:CheY-specific phosphatase CheX